jgi:hypothetical protein
MEANPMTSVILPAVVVSIVIMGGFAAVWFLAGPAEAQDQTEECRDLREYHLRATLNTTGEEQAGHYYSALAARELERMGKPCEAP